jgi:glutamate carboxypeptidase
MSPFLTYLKGQQAAMVQHLEQWVNQDSPTDNKVAVDEMGQMTVQAFVEAGATLEATYPQQAWGDHYKLTYGEGETQILILCHFDTVWPMAEARRRPFTIEGGAG